jgi:hypothetical protein
LPSTSGSVISPESEHRERGAGEIEPRAMGGDVLE